MPIKKRKSPEPMKLKPELLRRSYSIDIPVDDFIAVDKAEGDYGRNGLGNNTICGQLTKLLRYAEVEYNGHLGSCIYFTLDVEEDGKRNHGKIQTIIRNQILKARRYVERLEKLKR